MGPDWAALGKELRMGRLRLDLTQSEVATELGISKDTVRQLERGAGGSVRAETLAAYASLVGVRVALPVAEAG